MKAINKPDRGFFGGYRLEVAALDLPSLPAAGLPYGWGRDFASIIDNYRNLAGCFINGEDMPRAGNRITLSKTARDAYGLPVAHVHSDVHVNDATMRRHAQDQAAAMYEGIGAKRVVRGNMPPSTHNMGTARMSRDPADGVCECPGTGARRSQPVHLGRQCPDNAWCRQSNTDHCRPGTASGRVHCRGNANEEDLT